MFRKKARSAEAVQFILIYTNMVWMEYNVTFVWSRTVDIARFMTASQLIQDRSQWNMYPSLLHYQAFVKKL